MRLTVFGGASPATHLQSKMRKFLPNLNSQFYRYTEDAHPLYEEWFHCTDLGVQLKPVIARFMASEQHKTGVPVPGTILETPPIKLEVQKDAGHAFNLKGWVAHHKHDLQMHGKKSLNAVGEFKVEYYFGDRCNNEKHHWVGETWVWQLSGHSSIKLDSGQEVALQHGDSLLIKAGDGWSHSQSADGEIMVVRVDALANKH
jgi:3-hydroxyanthranilate 3,4-dioxygenase